MIQKNVGTVDNVVIDQVSRIDNEIQGALEPTLVK